VLRLAGSATIERTRDRLVVSAQKPSVTLLQSPHTPIGDQFAVTLDPRIAEEQARAGIAPDDQRPQVSIGLAKDAKNYLSVNYDHARGTVGWTLVTDDVDRSRAGEPEQLDALDGTVDLSKPGARLGISVRGSTVGVYVDQGDGWEFLFLLDIGGAVDLADPVERRQWRFATGVDLASGSHPVGTYEIRRQ
jgi:hypothetical protein